MRKIIFLFALGFVALFALDAQTAGNNLLIRDLTGGSGYDGKNAAALLASQDIIRNNFLLVRAPGQADFVIGGEIKREGLGYTATFVLSTARDETALAEETLYYRDFLEVAPYMPGIADTLARKALGLPPSRVAFLPKPEIPVIAAPAPLVPKEPPAPAPEEPAKASLVDTLKNLVKKTPGETPAPVEAEAAAEPALELEAPTEAAALNAWRNKLLYLGLWAGYDFSGGGISVAGELDWRPFKYVGIRIGLGRAHYRARVEHWSSYVYYNSGSPYYIDYWTQMTSHTDTESGGGFLYYIGPRINLPIGKFNLGLTGGFALIPVRYPEFDNTSYSYYNDDMITTTTGGFAGADFEMKAGPGMLFLTLNYIFTFSGSHREYYGNTSREEMYMNGASSINIGVGYRFGIINKKPWN